MIKKTPRKSPGILIALLFLLICIAVILLLYLHNKDGTASSSNESLPNQDRTTISSIELIENCSSLVDPVLVTLGGEGSDYANAFEVSNTGDIYIAGTSWSEALFSESNGNEVHNQRIRSFRGNLLLCKYDYAGEFQWVKTWASADVDACYGNVTSLATDVDSNVIVVGEFFGTLVFPDTDPFVSIDSKREMYAFVLKFTGDGHLLWAAGWRAYGYSDASPLIHTVTCDLESNIYIAGNQNYIRKYNPSGGLLWHRVVAGTVRGSAIDSIGNLYVCGMLAYESAHEAFSERYSSMEEEMIIDVPSHPEMGYVYNGSFVFMVNTDGELSWMKTWESNDSIPVMCSNLKGSVVLATRYNGRVNFDSSENIDLGGWDRGYYVLKFSETGEIALVGRGTDRIEISDVEINECDDVYVGGSWYLRNSEEVGRERDHGQMIIKLPSDGADARYWTRETSVGWEQGAFEFDVLGCECLFIGGCFKGELNLSEFESFPPPVSIEGSMDAFAAFLKF